MWILLGTVGCNLRGIFLRGELVKAIVKKRRRSGLRRCFLLCIIGEIDKAGCVSWFSTFRMINICGECSNERNCFVWICTMPAAISGGRAGSSPISKWRRMLTVLRCRQYNDWPACRYRVYLRRILWGVSSSIRAPFRRQTLLKTTFWFSVLRSNRKAFFLPANVTHCHLLPDSSL